jgi:type IV pilus assembly protein PilM
VVDWNKEISLRRKKQEPEAKVVEETPAEVTRPEAEAEEPVVEAAVEVSRPEAEAEAEVAPEPTLVLAPEPKPDLELAPEPEPELESAAEKTSLLKKEISFRRKPNQPKAPKTVKQPKAKKAKEPKEPKELKPKREKGERAPKQRRELHLPTLRLPRGGARGSKRVKRLVGLKIGASQLAAARVVNNGSPELVQVARENLEQGLIVGGELREPELLADALRNFFRKHKLPRQGVRLGIANNRIGVRIFEIAGITDPKQLENAIRFRAQEALPIPIEEAVLDYHVLGERLDDEGQKVRRILLVVAYRELIDRYVAACKKAGIRLAGIDLEAFALLRALGQPPAPDDAGPSDAALVVVALGHDRSTFAVSDGRVCEFTRVLDWGGSTLDVAIARDLDIAPSEAAPIKRELSLSSANVPEGFTQEQADAAREAVRRQLQSFARELVSSLQFYQNQPGSLGIGEIVITGGTAHLPGLAEELQKLIGVRVAVGDPLQRVKLGRKLRETEQLGSLAVAIGLGIED